MATLTSNKNLYKIIENMLQGLAFWMGYSKSLGVIFEHDCVHQAYTILRSKLGPDKYAIEYEYNYSDIDPNIKSRERADLVILKKTPKRKTPICVLEFKMSNDTNGGIDADVIKLRTIKKNNLIKLAILLVYIDKPELVRRFTEGKLNTLYAKRFADINDGSKAIVRRVCKAMATADNPKRNPFMAICIEA